MVSDADTDIASSAVVEGDFRARQKRGVLMTIIAIVTVVTLFMTMFMMKILSPRILSTEELRVNRAIVFDTPRIINDFALMDHRGESFEKKDLLGSWSLIYFGFTHCPDICPTTMAKLSQLVANLDADIAQQTQVLLVSVDPARDTPEKLAQYMAFFNPNFVGVTGDFRSIMKVTGNLNVAFNKVMLGGGDYTVDHTGHLVLVNPEGHYHGFFKPPFELSALKTTFQSIVSQYD